MDNVINLAVRKYRKESAKQGAFYTVEDAMVYALEEYDTGYNLTHEQYDNVLSIIKSKVKGVE